MGAKLSMVARKNEVSPYERRGAIGVSNVKVLASRKEKHRGAIGRDLAFGRNGPNWWFFADWATWLLVFEWTWGLLLGWASTSCTSVV